MQKYQHKNQTGFRSRSAEAMGTPSLDGSHGKGRRILPSLRRISTTPLKPRRRSSSSSSESSCPSPPPAPKQPARPSPLRSAAVAAARKTRRFFGAKSNDVLPGILGVFFSRHSHGSGCCCCCCSYLLLRRLVCRLFV